MTTSSLVRAALILFCAGLVVTGCGNIIDTEIIGATGVSVGNHGDPEAVIVVCSEGIDRVDLAGDRTGLRADEQNPLFGTWTSNQSLSRGIHRVSLTSPTDGWSFIGSLEAFNPDQTYILTAVSADGDLEASQIAFKGSDLDNQDDSTVVLAAGIWPAKTVLAHVCRDGQ